MYQVFKLSSISALMMTAFGSAFAQDYDVADLIKPDSYLSIGIGNWSGDRHQEGIYDGMREGGTYGLLNADVVKRDDSTGTWFKLKATNLGLDNRSIQGEYLQQGNIGLSLEYNQTTFDNPNTFTTRLQGVGTKTQTVSTSTALGPLQTIKLGTERDMTNIGFYKNLMPGLDFNVTFKNEEKTGDQAWGLRTLASNIPVFGTQPIDSTTRQLEATLNYTQKDLQLSGGYYGSWYDTKNTQTAFTTVATTTYLSQPLDNQAHQLFLNGGYNFTTSTRGTFKLAYTHATQNDDLSSGYTPLTGAPSSLNGEVNTTLAQLGFTSRPFKELSLLANLRYYNVDDATPVAQYVKTGACSTAGNCMNNTPYSYKTLNGKVEATYRLPAGYSITAGVDQNNQDRSIPLSTDGAGGTDNQRIVPYRYNLDETTYRLGLRRSLSDTINGAITYLMSDRTGSTYGSLAATTGNVISTNINPINIADRTRNKVRMGIDWSPAEALSVQLNIEDSRDNYAYDNPYGVRDGNAQLYSLDATYTLNDKWKLDAWYSFDHNQARQLNNNIATVGTNVKTDNLEDTGNSFGLGLRGDVSERIKMGADLQWTRDVSRYQQSLNYAQANNYTGNLPDITNTLIRLKFFSQYAIDKHSNVRLDLIHERWKTNDWTWMFADGTAFAYGTTTLDGTKVTANQNQTNNFIGVSYIYKF